MVTDSEAQADAVDQVLAASVMVPMLPCGDIDELADFWTALGLAVTYRQQRPNPYVALARGGLVLHYYGLPGWDPEQSHSTCGVMVADTGPLFELFAAGLRERYGRLPVRGLPRITRPRQRANNEGLAGFSLVDPAGNWIRVNRQQSDAPAPPRPTGALARAVDNAVVLADSHGDPGQARKILAGAIRRTPSAPVSELAPALAYLAELCLRTGDADAQRAAYKQLETLPTGTEEEQAVVAAALTEAEALLDPGP